MKVALYAVSLIAILIGAYFSSSLKSKFEAQIEERKTFETRNKQVSANADKEEKEVEEQRESLRAAQAEQAEIAASIESLQADVSTLQREEGQLDPVIARQQEDIKKARETLAEAQQVLRGLDVDGAVNPDNVGEAVKKLEDEKKELLTDISDLEAQLEGARNAVAASREEVSRQQKGEVERVRKSRRNALSARITAVDQNWGFVVVGAGRNSGFTQRDRMIVERDGRRIAEVTPSTIEANQLIAEIDLDTIAPGVALQPGDRVILKKAN